MYQPLWASMKQPKDNKYHLVKNKFIMRKIIYILSCIFFITSCEDDTLPQFELKGIYDGIFTVEYSEQQTFSNEVTITFNDSTYSCTSGENHIPAGGSGKFEIHSSTITFHDENGWFANFDWNLILDGEYDLNRDNSTIIISAHKNDVGFYKYEFEKQ
jgi:hypothetical protein